MLHRSLCAIAGRRRSNPGAGLPALGLSMAILVGCQQGPSLAAATDALTLERKIPLGDVAGRLDHLAVDLVHHRLFLAELGNDTIGVVDVAAGTLLHRIGGLKEPQGIGYVADTDTIYVANAGDGTLHSFRGGDFSPLAVLKLGDDADNIRVDAQAAQLVVGYGKGALALLEAAGGKRVGGIPLPGHPEAFQLDPSGARIYVNVPDAREIAVVDRNAAKEIARWGLPDAGQNFPMALDAAGKRLFVVYRRPALLAVFDTGSGAVVARLATCGDADDVFFDAKRQRAYVSCGDGALDVVEEHGGSYRELGRITTVSGARTSLWVSELDRLFLAVRARGSESAAIWVYRPADR
jgi:DNA-binding beta-propeller fold protein YncE